MAHPRKTVDRLVYYPETVYDNFVKALKKTGENMNQVQIENAKRYAKKHLKK